MTQWVGVNRMKQYLGGVRKDIIMCTQCLDDDEDLLSRCLNNDDADFFQELDAASRSASMNFKKGLITWCF